ncbi:MAG: type VI secretion system membrane subunit TssM, partial [bacterium]
MGWLTKTLKSRRMMIAIGFILLIVLILVIGALRIGESLTPLLTFTERILCVVLVVFLWILFFMYERMQEVRSAGLLEQSIQRQAEDQRRGVRPEKRAEIEQFQKELTAAIEALKKSRLGKGRRSGNAALYALPWYLMIGPPGGGKTTAIRNSGLDFPTGIDSSKELRGVGGTRNCEWFFSTSAILLDTAGRYVSEDDDREEWLAFLDMLKKHRRKKPINGVLVGFSIQDLLDADEDEINEHAQKIRQRIDELMQRLGFRFPVYLVFTKCDLLDGFVEFFGDLNRREREQIWGTSFTPEQIEQMKGSDPRATFAQEFQLLLEALTDLRMSRLHSQSPLKREQRRKVFLFPLQLAAVKDKMASFAGKLFQDNPYQKDNPIFRGFYFTSGTQEGVPLDRAIEAISREFGLPPLPSEGDGAETEIKHYFIKDLFNEVVIPDKDFLLGETSRAAEAKQLARLGIMVGSVLALGLFILGVSLDYNDSQKKMKVMAKAAQVVQDVKWPGIWGRNLGLLELLRQRMERYDEGGPILRFGMSRRGTMLEAARSLYFRKMKDFVDKYLFSELQRRLQGHAFNRSTTQEQAYNYLKAYLFMSDEVDRLNKNECDFLRGELMALLAPHFRSSDSSANGGTQDLQTLTNQHIKFFVENLSEKRIPAYKSDVALVNGARGLLIAPVTALSVYSKGIKSQGFAQMPGTFSVAGALGSGYANLLSTDKPVPNLFTRAGWDKFAKDAIARESQDPGREDWVLGNKDRQLSDEVKSPEMLAEKLRDFYFRDYIRVWWEFLRSLQYENLTDIGTASDRLKTLSEPGTSPLKVLLEKVSAEVSFDEGLKSIIKSGAQRVNIQLAEHPVDRAFVGLHAFISGENSPLTGALG